MPLAREIKQARKNKKLTQKQLADQIGVSTNLVSQWERNLVHPREYFDKLEDSLDIPLQIGKSLRMTREGLGVSVKELARKSGYSEGFIYNIENGNAPNPNPNTLEKLAVALGVDASTLQCKTEIGREEERHGQSDISELYNADVEKLEELLGKSGIYVLWSDKRQPIYIGQSDNIGRRCKDHKDKFWFRPPVVSSISYVEISDKDTRKSVEKLLLKVLQNILVINQNT